MLIPFRSPSLIGCMAILFFITSNGYLFLSGVHSIQSNGFVCTTKINCLVPQRRVKKAIGVFFMITVNVVDVVDAASRLPRTIAIAAVVCVCERMFFVSVFIWFIHRNIRYVDNWVTTSKGSANESDCDAPPSYCHLLPLLLLFGQYWPCNFWATLMLLFVSNSSKKAAGQQEKCNRWRYHTAPILTCSNTLTIYIKYAAFGINCTMLIAIKTNKCQRAIEKQMNAAQPPQYSEDKKN